MLPLILLAAPALAAPTLWGVQLGDTAGQVRARFKPDGDPGKGKWEKDGRRSLHYTCDARDRCFTVPRAADFYFHEGRLVAATLRADSDSAPPDESAMRLLLRAEGEAKLGSAAAISAAAGRRTRYFTASGATVAWTQDGPETEIKLHLDEHSPVGRAEAVAAGAPDTGLDALPGARDYTNAHLAIGQRDWEGAVRHLERALNARKAAPLLVTQVKLVLALSLAARAKSVDKARALSDLARARKLAPELTGDLDALASELGLPAQPTPP